MVANTSEFYRYKQDAIEILLKAQIENSLDLGWKPDDIILLTNFDFEFMSVRARNVKLNDFCLTGSKIFGIKWVYENMDADVVWAHDLDAWQNAEFKCPKFRDVGATKYYNRNYNGGSIFWRRSAKDIIDAVVEKIITDKAGREEPTLNIFLKKIYRDRVKTINHTFNVGSTGYIMRYCKSDKPIRVCHLHPYNRIAWETHVLDRTGVGIISVSRRLERLLRKYYPGLDIKLKEAVNEEKRKKAKELMSALCNKDTASGGDIK